MTKERILVTGGAGFIGSHLVDALVEQDYIVTVLDNLLTGNKENLESLISQGRISFVEGDIRNSKVLNEACKVDYIFHEAALPSVQRSIENPQTTLEINITGTLNMLNAARDNKVKKVIFASSSSIYGNRPGESKIETMKVQPLSPYAISKLACEEACKFYSHTYRLPTICLRYFNVFGPRQNPNSEYSAVIPKFINIMLKDNKPVIYGDGKQSRDFTFVNNVVNANLLALQSDLSEGETINIACGKSYSLMQMVEIINKTLDKNLAPFFLEPRAGEVKDSLANIDKAKKLLGYEPQVDFEEGLKKTIEWYKEH